MNICVHTNRGIFNIAFRFMAREAPKWRDAIGKMAEIAVTFENEIVNPVGFSNWK